jgi:GNAT superfamily N-acetyltransferase
MTASLRRLDAKEIEALAPALERRYATDLERNGRLPQDAARQKAADDVRALLADTAALMYAIEEDGRDVGRVCVGQRQLQERRVLWVWDVFVDEEQRGRGLGRAAMQLVEAQARRLGLARVELNVFGGNDAARGLYRSLGYEEWAVSMAKDLE